MRTMIAFASYVLSASGQAAIKSLFSEPATRSTEPGYMGRAAIPYPYGPGSTAAALPSDSGFLFWFFRFFRLQQFALTGCFSLMFGSSQAQTLSSRSTWSDHFFRCCCSTWTAFAHAGMAVVDAADAPNFGLHFVFRSSPRTCSSHHPRASDRGRSIFRPLHFSGRP